MREIHPLENIDETIEERAESELGYGVETGERVHAAKKNCCGLWVVVQRPGQIAPLHRECVDHGLAALLSLFSDLDGEINQ